MLTLLTAGRREKGVGGVRGWETAGRRAPHHHTGQTKNNQFKNSQHRAVQSQTV